MHLLEHGDWYWFLSTFPARVIDVLCGDAECGTGNEIRSRTGRNGTVLPITCAAFCFPTPVHTVQSSRSSVHTQKPDAYITCYALLAMQHKRRSYFLAFQSLIEGLLRLQSCAKEYRCTAMTALKEPHLAEFTETGSNSLGGPLKLS